MNDVSRPARGRSLGLALLLAACAFSAPVSGQGCQPFKVLVFWKTAGFVHTSAIANGLALIQSLGAANGFMVDNSNDATVINPANLAQYAAVIFLHTTGDILDATQQTAFEGFITGGGGFVGIHSAADTEYGWPFYGALLGAYFASHPLVQTATLSVVDATHPSTAGLPATFAQTDEWYNFQTNPASNPLIHVLLTVDETTYVGGTMGNPHPIAWYQENPGLGRSWYTALGHTDFTYTLPFFHSHLLGGIVWAAGSARTRTICGGSLYGAASGSPLLALGGVQTSPSAANLVLSGAIAGAAGVLAASGCAASVPSGPLTVLVDLAPPGFIGFVPLSFDAAGQSQLPIQLAVQLPGTWGNVIFLQGAQLGPSLGLSNGLQLTLCP
jgi:type 1 glutamine amidotransferase